ncbi:hypothetical protein HDU91_004967 [Kappamyces sp. JEL0680]|nr:hypothetical protein HDU91_004967 [Kappamyces sp. JEL0680]
MSKGMVSLGKLVGDKRMPKVLSLKKIEENDIPSVLNPQKKIVIGPKGDRDRFVEWIRLSLGSNTQVQVVGIEDLPKMISAVLMVKNHLGINILGLLLLLTLDVEVKSSRLSCTLKMPAVAMPKCPVPSPINPNHTRFNLVDSGPPPAKLATGTPICQLQAAAIQVSIPATPALSFASTTLQLDASLALDNATITLSLCKATGSSGPPDDLAHGCQERDTFAIPSVKRIEARWESVLNPRLEPSANYWLVVEGNGDDFSTSFSWLDADSFKATTAFRDESGWTVTPDVAGASTLLFTVETA